MSSVAPAVEPAGPARTSGLGRDLRTHPLCARREPRHRLCLRPAGHHPVRRDLRPLHRALRSARQRYRGGVEAAVRGALVRHRSIGPRHLQPRRRRHTARHVHRGRLRGAGVPDGRAGRHRRRLFRRLDRPHRRPRRRHHHGVSAVRAGDGHRRGARQHRAEHHHRDRDRELSALCARRARRGQCAPQRRFRAGGAAVGQWRVPDSAGAHPAQHHADHDRADVADHGLRDPRTPPVFPSSGSACGRRRRNGASWSRKARASWCRANGGSRCSRGWR